MLQNPGLNLTVAAFTGWYNNSGIAMVMEQQELPSMPECIDEIIAFCSKPVGNFLLYKLYPYRPAPNRDEHPSDV
jgi:hypothetical protein